MPQRFLTAASKWKWTALLALPLCLAPAARPQAREIYPDPGHAKSEIQAAIQRAHRQHKRVILDFGGNWCGDCQVLYIYFHDPNNKPLLDANFELVEINIGHYDANLDIAEQYGIPLKRGVPALVVLSSNGKVLYAQRDGEFEKMARLQSSDLTAFLNKWKPAPHTDGHA